MKRFYLLKGDKMDKTMEEILKEDITYASEDSNFYYIRPKTVEEYDTTMWKIDKSTEEVEFVDFPWYIANVLPNAKEIDISKLK